MVDGMHVPASGIGSLIVFSGLDEGVLNRAGRTIRAAQELEKAKADIAQLNKDIELVIQQQPKFTPAATADAKIKAFIK